MRPAPQSAAVAARSTILASLALSLPALLALSFLALFALVPTAGAASGDLAWQRTYNGTGNDLDRYSVAAPAPNGGVYVAGLTFATGYDMLVARYDAAGQRRWLRTYDGPANGPDDIRGAAADGNGNLVVVGHANRANMAVIKYGAGGQRRWVRIYDDPQSILEEATDVAIDAAGNVYVAGWRLGAASGYDIVLIKYSPAGNRRWVRHYNGPGGGFDLPAGIAGDAAGNVYVAGVSLGAGTGYDVTTLKYDPAGHRRWVKRWDGPGGGDDSGYAIAVSGAGAVYVAGATAGVSSAGDAVLLKYGTGGTLGWSRTRTSAGAFDDLYLDVTLLGNGDVVATGSRYGGLGHGDDVLLARLSSAGQTRWWRTYNGPDGLLDAGRHVAQGTTGAIYVAGHGNGAATGVDTLTLKYNATGALRWARRSSSTGALADFDGALVVRSASVYVAGYQSTGPSSDATLLRYRP